MKVRSAGSGDAALMAALHARAFDRPWSEAEFAQLLATGAEGAVAGEAGFILWRTAAGEAEILTLAVDPDQRRKGLGRRLVDVALASAQAVFLEVAADNTAAIALYLSAGFEQAGVRRGYYARAGRSIDALVLKSRA